MHVRLELPPGTKVTVEEDSRGRITALCLEPVFLSAQGLALLAAGSALTEGGVCAEHFSLLVSGTTGKVSKKVHKKLVQPRIDLPVASVMSTENTDE